MRCQFNPSSDFVVDGFNSEDKHNAFDCYLRDAIVRKMD